MKSASDPPAPRARTHARAEYENTSKKNIRKSRVTQHLFIDSRRWDHFILATEGNLKQTRDLDNDSVEE